MSLTEDRGELPVHTIDAVPWAELPDRCIIQLHWHPVEPLLSRFRHRLRVVTVTRHPLAVLVSILQYCQHIDETWKWLSGREEVKRAPQA